MSYAIEQFKKQNLNHLKISESEGKTCAVVCLDQGGRLSELLLKGEQLLADFDHSTYKDNYASSVLFPFVNRVKNGKYSFGGVDYQLACNDVALNNALHGLVYDKQFTLSDSTATSDSASVTLIYEAAGDCPGFPFAYRIALTYTVSDEIFSLKVEVTNTGNESFPYGIGWHPYFLTPDLFNSNLVFECKEQFKVDHQQIPDGTTPFTEAMPFQIGDSKLDDGYILENNQIAINTPNYKLVIESSSPETYLQVYTPDVLNVIAVEPQTAAPDCLNNEMGLEILDPGHNTEVCWNLRIS